MTVNQNKELLEKSTDQRKLMTHQETRGFGFEVINNLNRGRYDFEDCVLECQHMYFH